MSSLSERRLRVKKAFTVYYLALCGPGIADPTPLYEALQSYFHTRSEEVGPQLFALEFEDDVERLAGEIEQDLRQRHKDLGDCFARDPLDERFREAVVQAGGGLAEPG